MPDGGRHTRCLPTAEQTKIGGRCLDLHTFDSAPVRQDVERVEMMLHEPGRAITAAGLDGVQGWFRDVDVLPSGEVLGAGGRGLMVGCSDARGLHWTVTPFSGLGRRSARPGRSGTVLRTRDAGAHWQAVDIGAGDTQLMGLDSVDAAHGCIAGGIQVWCTTGAGDSWHAATLELPRATASEPVIGMTRLQLRDAGEGWPIARNGLVYTSDDGGCGWTLWLDLARPGRTDSAGVTLTGLALGRDRAWVAGAAALKPGPDAEPRWDTRRSPLLLSWPLAPALPTGDSL